MNELVTLDVGYKRDLEKDEMKTKEIRKNDGRTFYMTTQQPQPAFFSFGDSCSAVTTGGLHFGVVLPWVVGSCTLGMGLYPETLLRRCSGSCGAASGHVLPSVSVFGGGCGGCEGSAGAGGGSLFSVGALSGEMANGANSRS